MAIRVEIKPIAEYTNDNGVMIAPIPHIINGVSANTLFYLINFKKMFENRSLDAIGDIYANSTHPDIPYDLDDFSRIMNAYRIFNWSDKDIEKAKKTAKKLGYGKRYMKFLDEFAVLKSFYEDGEEGDEDFRELLDEIKYGETENNEKF